MLNKRKYRRGFIEIRTIIALIIIISILPIVTTIFSLVSNYHIDYNVVNDEISLLELRRIMLIAYDINNNYDELNFIYHNDNYSLSLINNRLVLSPGYQVFLNNVDDLYFDDSDGVLSIVYERNNEEKRAYIYKEKGIYIDDFSTYVDECDESTSIDE